MSFKEELPVGTLVTTSKDFEASGDSGCIMPKGTVCKIVRLGCTDWYYYLADEKGHDLFLPRNMFKKVKNEK